MKNNTINSEINERVNNLFETYKNVISPFIVQLEIIDNAFPTEILNEIRATMTHLAKMNLADNNDVIEENITKAERHIKRAVLDCYKYSCLSYDMQYKTFETRYKRVDLSVVDNGEFVVKLSKMRQDAVSALRDAKLYELEPDADDEELFKKYETAYNCYFAVYTYISNAFNNLEKAKHKGIKDTTIAIIGTIAGVLGLAVGIIGVLL